MSTWVIQVDDETASLVRKAAGAVNQPVEDWVRASLQAAATKLAKDTPDNKPRIAPLHPGMSEIGPDFKAPLEEFARYA